MSPKTSRHQPTLRFLFIFLVLCATHNVHAALDTDGDHFLDGPDKLIELNGEIVIWVGEDKNGNGKFEPAGLDGIYGTEDDEYDPNNPVSHPDGSFYKLVYPPAPTGLHRESEEDFGEQLLSPESQRVRLVWDPIEDPDLETYEIYKSIGEGNVNYIKLAETNNNTYIDTLTPLQIIQFTPVNYYVCAIYSGGIGALLNINQNNSLMFAANWQRSPYLLTASSSSHRRSSLHRHLQQIYLDMP
jgi:hypothetical protein